MTLPRTLQILIAEALESVRRHPQHDLTLGYRQAIWAAFGPALDTYQTYGSEAALVGHQRRVFLAVLTVRHVLPIWLNVWPNNQSPRRLLTHVEQVMKGKMSKDMALDVINRWWDVVDELGARSQNMAVTVGFAALQALATAAVDEMFEPDEIDVNLTDSEEFDNNDASFYAAVAYANGPIWKIAANAKPDSAKRGQFWQWWLTEAVPAAYKSVPEADFRWNGHGLASEEKSTVMTSHAMPLG